MVIRAKLINCCGKQSYLRVAFSELMGQGYDTGFLVAVVIEEGFLSSLTWQPDLKSKQPRWLWYTITYLG
jgi:hypothetical protein